MHSTRRQKPGISDVTTERAKVDIQHSHLPQEARDGNTSGLWQATWLHEETGQWIFATRHSLEKISEDISAHAALHAETGLRSLEARKMSPGLHETELQDTHEEQVDTGTWIIPLLNAAGQHTYSLSYNVPTDSTDDNQTVGQVATSEIGAVA